jgi:adenosylcobyric acid synthase
MELINPDELETVRGFIINKFRGDIGLLEPGLEFLRQRTGKPVIGVVPFVPDLRIADEDSLSLEGRVRRPRPGPQQLDVVVVRLPRISNYDDVSALEHEPDVSVRFAERGDQIAGADLVILPGTKSTIADLGWLRDSGMASAVVAHAGAGGLLLGICGGCQMLGRQILDPLRAESDVEASEGLGLLELDTVFEREKTTAQVLARVTAPCFLTRGVASGEVPAYEIHMGQARARPAVAVPFRIERRNGAVASAADGAVNAAGNVVGTLLHGLLEHTALRAGLIAALWERRGEPRPELGAALPSAADEYDRLAAVVRQHLDFDSLRRLARIA